MYPVFLLPAPPMTSCCDIRRPGTQTDAEILAAFRERLDAGHYAERWLAALDSHPGREQALLQLVGELTWLGRSYVSALQKNGHPRPQALAMTRGVFAERVSACGQACDPSTKRAGSARSI